MLQVLGADPKIGIVGAELRYPDGRPQYSHGPLPTLALELASLWGLDKRPTPAAPGCLETGAVSGACFMVRRAMLDQIGLLDERYFMFSEEIDLCARAHRAGWKVVYLPGACVTHLGGGSTGQTARRVLLLYRAKLQYFEKYARKLEVRLLWSGMWVATLAKGAGYTLLRWASLGRLCRDGVWWEVSACFGELPR